MSKGINKFTEKEIHKSITSKVPGELFQKRTSDPKMIVEIGGKKIFTMRIPNDHAGSYLSPKESKRIAQSLKLENDEYNKLIKCNMKSRGITAIIKERFQLL